MQPSSHLLTASSLNGVRILQNQRLQLQSLLQQQTIILELLRPRDFEDSGVDQTTTDTNNVHIFGHIFAFATSHGIEPSGFSEQQ